MNSDVLIFNSIRTDMGVVGRMSITAWNESRVCIIFVIAFLREGCRMDNILGTTEPGRPNWI